MPLRNSLSDYRYAYQGQEKDPETGKEAFELRLWDARIGRWLTTDPYRQFHSPYLAMGNNPVKNIDSDGGYCYDSNGNQVACSDLSTQTGFDLSAYEGPTEISFNMLNEVVISSGSNINNDFNDIANVASLFNFYGTATFELAQDAIPTLGVDDFKLRSFDPAIGYDLLDDYPGQVFIKGTSQSVDQLVYLSKGLNALSKTAGYVGYTGAIVEAYNGDLVGATAEAGSNFMSNSLGNAYGPDVGLAWAVGWELGRVVTSTDVYGRVFYKLTGLHSHAYLKSKGLKYR